MVNTGSNTNKQKYFQTRFKVVGVFSMSPSCIGRHPDLKTCWRLTWRKKMDGKTVGEVKIVHVGFVFGLEMSMLCLEISKQTLGPL